MDRPDDHLERLISRKLDGELSADESLELDKCLIREPLVRQHLEESEKIDELAGAFLNEVCAERDDASFLVGTATQRKHRFRWFGAVPVAAAACLALWLSWPMFSSRSVEDNAVAARGLRGSTGETPRRVASDLVLPPSNVRLAGSTERSASLVPIRETGTRVNYYGVLDETSNKLYLLEVRRLTSTQRRSQGRRHGMAQGNVVLASGEM